MTYNEKKYLWCKNLIDTALDGSIDLDLVQNIFVQDLWLVAGAAYDQLEKLKQQCDCDLSTQKPEDSSPAAYLRNLSSTRA